MTEPRPLPKSAVLVVNAKSRRGREAYRDAVTKLRAAGVELTATHAVRRPDKLNETVREAVAAGAKMVIVGGGDGSLSCSVDYFVQHDCVFALLPLGTANSFARTMGIPLDLDGAIDVIANGVRRRVDLGMIDNDYYANCATIGIAPLIAETVPHRLKRALGRAGYLSWAAYQFTRFKPFHVIVTVDGKREEMDAVEVRIANGSYHGGSEMVEDARVDSGEIVVQVVIGNAKHRLLTSWAASLMKLQLRKKTWREFHAKELRIETIPPLPISIDGELLARSPVTARVASQVIEVAAPRPEPTAAG